MNRPLSIASTYLILSSVSGLAAAHITLSEPPARAEGGTQNEQKNAPCGQNPNGRTDTVTTFMPGETITVSWEETIDHPSYYRVAIDLDGDDDFPMQAAGEDENVDPATEFPLSDTILGYHWESRDGECYQADEPCSMEITLPNVNCDNCTLQLIQYMYGSGNPNYFQCADIAIEGAIQGEGGAGGGGAGGGDMGGGAGAPDVGGSSGMAGGGAGASSGGSAGTAGGGASTVGDAGGGGTAGSAGAIAAAGSNPIAGMDSGEDDGGGCTLSPTSRPRNAALLLGLMGAAWGLLLRRRRP